MNIIQSGNTMTVYRDGEAVIHNKLPVGTYVCQFEKRTESYYLTLVDDFTLPQKLYGDVHSRVEKISTTFMSRESTTGVLMCGQKGSGKTILAKAVCLQLAKIDVPTIIINSNFKGDTFNAFIQSINQPVVILFDEFEKVYGKYSGGQDELLTLLDGSFTSKKLFLMTANDYSNISTHLINRPGRIYYSFEFEGLEDSILEEYLGDNLVDTDKKDSIFKAMKAFSVSTFDIVDAIVEEINRYGEDVNDVINNLNIKPESSSIFKYSLKMMFKGETLYTDVDYKFRTDDFSFIMYLDKIPSPHKEDESLKNAFTIDEYSEDIYFHVNMDNFTAFKPTEGKYTFEKGDVKVEVTQYTTEKFNYSKVL